MKKIFTRNKFRSLGIIALLGASSLASTAVSAQDKATGMSDFTLFIDPGHALTENQGLYGYSEAQKTLRVAKAMREYLETYTDIKKVYLCREDDNTQITLAGRTDMANALNVDFYYSIHSDSGEPGTNSTLFMYGGWKTDGVVIEKTPKGAKDFGEILTPDLTATMRITSTRGNLADRTYYDAANNHTNKYPYLHVNRESNMTSLLSEAGFHTNPTQQMRNLNAEWKRMEGYSAFRSMAKYMNVARPEIGIATGIITDSETGLAVNGATVTIGDKTYTTDSYASLFKNHSKDPEELRNGFYFIEGLNVGETVNVVFSSPEFESVTKQLTIVADPAANTFENLSVLDVQLLNLMPSKVVSVSANNLGSVLKEKPLVIGFSRKMNKATVESALSVSPAPATPITWTWKNDFTLELNLSSLDYATPYILKIDGSIAKNSQTDKFIDGDGDSVEGGDYILNLKTAELDNEAPKVVSYDPADNAEEKVARPIVRIEYNENLDLTSVLQEQIQVTTSNGDAVDGVVKSTNIGHKSVVHFLFSADLNESETYKVTVLPGIRDIYENAVNETLEFSFKVKPRKVKETVVIDKFETLGRWFAPGGSGSTTGINKEKSTVTLERNITASVESPSSMKMTYLWDENFTGSVYRIRQHNPATTPKFTQDYTIQAYVFGDGTGSNFRMSVRDGGIISNKPVKVDWVGWKLMSWDLTNDEHMAWLAGDGKFTGKPFYFENFGYESPTKPTEFVTSYLCFDELVAVIFDNSEVGINEGAIDTGIKVTSTDNKVNVSADSNIKNIEIYTLTGSLVKRATPNVTEKDVETTSLASGVYVVKVVTENAQRNVKVIVK